MFYLLYRMDCAKSKFYFYYEKSNPYMEEADKKRVFRQFSFRGYSLEEIMEMELSKFIELIPTRLRRHALRGLNKYENDLLNKVEEYHKEEKKTGEKPSPIKTYEANMPIFPCMIGTTIAVHCGNGFYPVDIKPDMLGKRLGDYIMTRTICTHGKPGIGASAGSKFVPLK